MQYAAIAGATVVAVDVQQDTLDLARELGATHTVDASQEDPVKAIQRLGGADVAVVLAVQPEAVEKAFASLRRGGRLVLVYLPKDAMLELPIFDTVLKGISVIGSIVGTRQDLVDVFALHAAGRTHVVLEERKLDEINEASRTYSPAGLPHVWSSACSHKQHCAGSHGSRRRAMSEEPARAPSTERSGHR